MKAWSMVGLSLLFSLSLGVAAAQDSPENLPQPTPSPADEEAAFVVEDVEIVGLQTEREIRSAIQDFVAKNMAPPPGRRLARWSRPVCVATANLAPVYAQAIIDRIALRILEVGGEIKEPECRPDVMVIGSSDGAAMAQAVVEGRVRLFRISQGGTDLGRAGLAAFQTGQAPVRWWHISIPVMRETGEPAISLLGGGPPLVKVGGMSRLRSNIREDMAKVMIILDFNQFPPNVNLGALADYLAFVALAQVDVEGEVGHLDTVLSLFDNPQDVTGMTPFDLEYLSALYQIEPGSLTRAANTRAISSEIIRSRKRRQ